MSSKHTPGPWLISGELRLVGDPERPIGQSREYCADIELDSSGSFRGDICRIQSCLHIDGIKPSEAEANARLIAAAPDLLEAAKAVEESLAQFRSEKSVDLSRLRAAIAKAEGQS